MWYKLVVYCTCQPVTGECNSVWKAAAGGPALAALEAAACGEWNQEWTCWVSGVFHNTGGLFPACNCVDFCGSGQAAPHNSLCSRHRPFSEGSSYSSTQRHTPIDSSQEGTQVQRTTPWTCGGKVNPWIFWAHVDLAPRCLQLALRVPARGSVQVLWISGHFQCKGSLAFAQRSKQRGSLSSPGSFRFDLLTPVLILTWSSERSPRPSLHTGLYATRGADSTRQTAHCAHE